MRNTLLQLSILLCLALLAPACTPSQPALTEWPTPTKEMKPWTRWWWMGSDVDSTNLTWNLEQMAAAGLGGVEVTPIYGVKGREANYIAHLSEKWMQMLNFTQAEATRLGMGVDMNTGTGWPFGGPEITLDDAATKALFNQYTLKPGQTLNTPLEVTDPRQQPHAQLNMLMAYTPDGKSINLTNLVVNNKLTGWTAPAGGDTHLVALFIGKTLQRVKRAAPGGEGYVLNHFDRQAVMRYFNKFETAFATHGVPVPGSFFNDSYEVYGADWTPTLLTEFEQLRGYRLQDHFMDLLADGATDASVRVISDYRETIGEMLKQNFTLPWTEWAHRLGATTRNQAHGSPANLIDIYAAVDVPECESFGISDFDIPGLRKDSIRKQNDGDPTILKYASSAAHITGKPYTSSETFTWLTEHFRTSLSQCKPEVDQMFTAGVNHVYFHGSTYSPQNAPWPGWKFYAAVDMSPTNPMWQDAPAFFNYITRTQSFLQAGEPDNDFLLYFPMHDIWSAQRGAFFTTFAIHGMRARLPEFCDGVEEIMQHGYDLDYISDHYLQNTRVENGLLKTVGGATYKALILPAVKLIPLETMEQICKLARQGATVVFMDHYPTDVPGLAMLESRRAGFHDLLEQLPAANTFAHTQTHNLGKGRIITGSSYAHVLPACEARPEHFVAHHNGKLIRRKHAHGHHYFMTMLGNNPIDGWVTLGVDAQSAMFFDPMTGVKGQAALRRHNGQTQVYMQLKPGQSVLLKTFTHTANLPAEAWSYHRPANAPTAINSEEWTLAFTQSQPPVATTYTLPTPTDWTTLPNDTLKINRATGCYTTTFSLHKTPGSEYRLNLGDVRESARVSINGRHAATLFAVPFEVNIGALLNDGLNTISVEVTNLPANHIAHYDRTGVQWRIFHDANIVSITYQPTKFDVWGTLPAGLLGPVTITELHPFAP